MPIVGQQPSGGGGNSNNNIQLILGLAQMQQQREEAAQRNAIAERQARTEGLSAIAGIAQRTADPTQLLSLAELASKNGLGDQATIMRFLSNIVPSAESAKTGMAVQGFNTARGLGPLYGNSTPEADTIGREAANTFFTGEGAGTVAGQNSQAKSFNLFEQNTPKSYRDLLGSVMGTKATTGMAPDELALSLATAGLPQDQQNAMAQVKGGLRLSAGQNANLQLGYAGVRENSVYHTGEIGVQSAGLDLDLAKAKMAAGAKNNPHIVQLLEQQSGILKDLTTGSGTMSNVQIQLHLGALQQINQEMAANGMPTVPIALDKNGNPDPQQVFHPGFMGYAKAWLQSK